MLPQVTVRNFVTQWGKRQAWRPPRQKYNTKGDAQRLDCKDWGTWLKCSVRCFKMAISPSIFTCMSSLAGQSLLGTTVTCIEDLLPRAFVYSNVVFQGATFGVNKRISHKKSFWTWRGVAFCWDRHAFPSKRSPQRPVLSGTKRYSCQPWRKV